MVHVICQNEPAAAAEKGFTNKHADAVLLYRKGPEDGPANMLTCDEIARSFMKGDDGRFRPLVLAAHKGEREGTVGVVQADYIDGRLLHHNAFQDLKCC